MRLSHFRGADTKAVPQCLITKRLSTFSDSLDTELVARAVQFASGDLSLDVSGMP